MYKSRLHKKICMILGLLILAVLPGCNEPKIQETVKTQEEKVKIVPGAYDSEDTAIVIAKQEKQKKITFFNLAKKKNYTLNYDGTTKFMDKYGSAIVVEQLEEGEVAELQFLKGEKLLTSLTASPDIWTMSGISKYELDLSAGRIKIMDEYYTIDGNTIVISQGKQVDFLDINAWNSLKIKGAEHKIYSISIEKGHGYLRLENDEYFVGGWIEVGQKIIQKIEEDMLLTVPEGTYEVYLSHEGIEGTKEVKISRNQETLLDVGDLKKDDLIKYGTLIFTLEPSTAKVYIDGKAVDTSRTVRVTYGLHQIMVKEEGYETVIQYIRVTENSANVAVTLEEEKEYSVSENSVSSAVTSMPVANPSVSQNTTDTGSNTSQNTNTGTGSTASGSASDSASTGYKVSIVSPQGAEAYVNGNYIGIIPASFKNKAGSYEIIVRKSGYTTRSYTIQVEDEDKDISFSFSDLTPIE